MDQSNLLGVHTIHYVKLGMVCDSYWLVRGVRARSARILIISLKRYEYHIITHLYHCTLELEHRYVDSKGCTSDSRKTHI